MQLTDKELKIAKIKYQNHVGHCRGRIDRAGNPIEMRLSFEEWLNIWLTSGHWHERGCGKGQYVMSRFNDIGHYEVGNVEIKSVKENIIEKTNSTKWQENNKLAMQKKSLNPEWRENNKLAMQNKSNEWRENNKLAIQKACNKQISCDSVIYASKIQAALALAPETRLTENSKVNWFRAQMKKFPERYFYVTESE